MFNAGVRGKRSKDTTGIITVGEHFNQQSFLVPTVTRFAVTDGSFVDTNDTAADTAGSQTIVLYGSGFAPGATVLVGSTTIGAVTFLDSGRLTFSSPALGSGSYTIFVTNANGGTGILVPGLVYSGVPTFTTSAGSLGSVYETTAISTTVVATGDAPITYALSSGSLPSGSTLSSSGTISGTAPVDGSSTTYSFTVQATDAQNQDSVRSFSLTINTDVVSFSSPANNTTTSVSQNSPISNVTPVATSAAGYGVLYTSSGLPTGLSMNTSTGIISGTPTVVASNTSIITATANTTSRTAALYLNWTITLPGDAFWKYASLLMSANTVPNGNTFNTDLSTFNNEVVVVADTKPSEFHPFKEGYYSNYFDGTGDYLAILTSSAFNIATKSFTVEAWINTSSATQQSIFNISDTASVGFGAVRVQVLSNQTVQWLMGPGGSWGVAVTAGSITLGTWNHIAITRNGSSVYFFINGLQVGTTQTYATSLTTGGTTYIGYNSGTSYGFNGYISNFRLVNGTAVYTANTTLSTSPLTYVANTSLLTCQSNKLIDNSNNNFTIVKGGDTTVSPFSPFNGTPTTVTVPAANNYSMYFDGTGDYLSVPANAAFAFGTGDFTVEFWMYCNVPWNSMSNPGVVGQKQGDGTAGWQIYRNSSSNDMYVRIVGGNDYGSAATPATQTWEHWALVRSGSNLTWYRNGTATFTHTGFSQNITDTAGLLYIGYTQTWGGYLNAIISNLRIVKGTAVYTATFTPPTAPLTAISGTSLLTCQANTVIDNSNNAFTITTNGNARPARNGPFANTTTVTLVGNEGSAYFDGTGDYLTLGGQSNFAFGTNSWTVEFWVYFTGTPGTTQLFDGRPAGTGSTTNYVSIGTNTSVLNYYTSSANPAIAGPTLVTRQWYHVAVCRSVTSTRLFVNGTQYGSTISDSQTYIVGASRPILGADGNVPTASLLTGYLSNVRVVNGTALYTSAFVPTFAPLTPVANTVLLTAQTNLSSNTKVFVDESNYNNIITGNGNANLGSFSPFGSSWSNYFDGTGDYLQTPSSTFSLGTVFTIEAWVYPTTSPTNAIVFSSTTSGELSLGYYSNSGFGVSATGVSWLLYSGTMPVVGAWNHIAVVRAGLGTNQTSIYINGTRVVNGTISNAFTGSGAWRVGFDGGGGGSSWTGYISNLRVVAGTDLYGYTNTTITPPTAPLTAIAKTRLLTCNSNKFVDYSVANNVITKTGDAAVSKFSPFSSVTVTPASYSGYFDGTGDYLTTPVNAGFDMGTEDFTVECFVINNGYSGSQYGRGLFVIYTSGNYNNRFMVRLNSSANVMNMYGNGSSTYLGVSGTNGTITLNNNRQWYHIAVVRQSGVFKLYVDGVQDIIVSNQTSISLPSSSVIEVGRNQDGSIPDWNGLISNFRVVKGTAVYTTTFTPPTAPLTVISGTSLLTCQSTTFIDNSANTLAITVNGNAKPVIQNPFTDTVGTETNYSANTFGNSVYFDGTGDYASYTASLLIAGTFTAECWFYNTSTSGAQQTLFAFNSNSGTFASIRVDCDGNNASNQMLALLSTGGSAWNTNIGVNNAYVKGVWNHVAITRDSSNLVRFFVNGVVIATATQAGTLYNTSTIHGIGINTLPGTPGNPFQGYISNLRMTNGQALYTGPFIPSGQPSPVTSNTTLLLASTVGPSVTDALRISNIETFGTSRYVANNSPYYDTYSAFFDGTGDYLTFGANQANLGLGTGDFTFEFWFNAATIPSTEVDFFESQTNNSLRVLKRASSSGLSFDPYGGTATLIMADASITTNTWHHVAISRTSGTTSAYYDGTRVVNQADSTNYATPTANYGVGGRASGANYLNGYISNMRLIKGTGLYSGTTITVPTGPLTAIANTSLLTCQSNRFIDNSTNAFTITKAGDAKITTLQPFTNSNTSRFSSVYFPAKTDYLAVRPQPSLITFPGDFTFECWVYPTDATVTNWRFWDSRQAGATGAAMNLGLSPLASAVSGSYRMEYYNATAYFGTITVYTNQWTHLAYVRSGTTMTFYVNGVAGGTATISGTQTGTATTAPIYIGSKDGGIATYGSIGYISDFRITNGYARTITVPTAPYDIK